MFDFFAAYPRAEADRVRAIEIAPESAAVLNALAWFYVDLLPTPENLKKAADLAEKAASLEKEVYSRGNYMDTRGWALYLLGRQKEALAILEEAAGLTPYNFTILTHLHQARRKEKAPQQKKRLSRKA
jgi:tetratricopeptide (TPR) repeat protein